MTPITRAALCILVFTAIGAAPARSDDAFGRFDRDPIVRLNEDGQTIELLSGLAYTDPKATLWSAPAGFVSNGASIPSAFWSVIGSPLSGRYRDAAIIHDYYCVSQERSWEATHQAFYHAMRARGVGEFQANIMYGAVYRFGPRWTAVKTGERIETFSGKPVLIDGALEAIRGFVESRSPSPEELRGFLDDFARIKSADELETALTKHVGCTPVIESAGEMPLPSTADRVIVLCGMNAKDKRLAAVSNLDAMINVAERLLRRQSQFVPAARRYSKAPSPQLWKALQAGVADLSLKVKTVMKATLNIEEELDAETQARVDRVLLLLAERTRALAQIRTDVPASAEAMNNWAENYDRLRRDLQTEIRALRSALVS